MVYKINDKNLPLYVKNRTPEVINKWISINNNVSSNENEQIAIEVANKWLQREMSNQAVVAQSLFKREKLVFEIDNKQLIKQSANGDKYISAVLASDKRNAAGRKFKPQVLKKWAEEINAGKTLVGDIDHEMFDKLADSAPVSAIKKALANKPSIAKTVKAIYEEGKLWLRLLIDKRYEKVIQRAKGLSLEALTETDENNEVSSGELFGFTFCVREPLADNTATILN